MLVKQAANATETSEKSRENIKSEQIIVFYSGKITDYSKTLNHGQPFTNLQVYR